LQGKEDKKISRNGLFSLKAFDSAQGWGAAGGGKDIEDKTMANGYRLAGFEEFCASYNDKNESERERVFCIVKREAYQQE
jgi:hypothetical protein